MFGAISALFSGLALPGVVYAILLQREELSFQRQELQLTREELARSAKAQESAEVLRKQLALVEETKAQDAARRRADSAARLGAPGPSVSNEPNGCLMQLDLQNLGGPMRQIAVEDSGAAAPLSLERGDFVPTGGRFRLIGRYKKSPKVIQIHLSYLDRDDVPRRIRIIYELEVNRLIAEEMTVSPSSTPT